MKHVHVLEFKVSCHEFINLLTLFADMYDDFYGYGGGMGGYGGGDFYGNDYYEFDYDYGMGGGYRRGGGGAGRMINQYPVGNLFAFIPHAAIFPVDISSM